MRPIFVISGVLNRSELRVHLAVHDADTPTGSSNVLTFSEVIRMFEPADRFELDQWIPEALRKAADAYEKRVVAELPLVAPRRSAGRAEASQPTFTPSAEGTEL
jgi:hypothetical protein